MPTINHPTLKAEEVALLQGEQTEPTWKSPNELIHERVNFDDTIWGFGLAGGAHYRTPLRVTYVKPGSRAQMAHIFPGDVVLKINGIDSSTLTLKQAHKIILESGIHLVMNVTAPEDDQVAYYCYEDPLLDELSEEEKARQLAEKKRKTPRPYSKCSHWGLQWPWKCRKKPIYKESNCYLVPSKFVEKHRDKLLPEVKPDDTIVLDSIYNVKGRTKETGAERNSNNAVNDNLEQVNEEIESNNPVNNNKDVVPNSNDNENDPNLDPVDNTKNEVAKGGENENDANFDSVENNKNEVANGGDNENDPNFDPVDNNKNEVANGGINENDPNFVPVDNNKNGVANDDNNGNDFTIDPVDNNKNEDANGGEKENDLNSDPVDNNKNGVANGDDNGNDSNIDPIDHNKNEVANGGNNGNDSNIDPVDNNKNEVANGGENENDPNLEKNVIGSISEVSKSEKVITNGR